MIPTTPQEWAIQNYKFIKWLAWKISSKWGFVPKDSIGEIYLILVNCWKHYKVERANTFPSYLQQSCFLAYPSLRLERESLYALFNGSGRLRGNKYKVKVIYLDIDNESHHPTTKSILNWDWEEFIRDEEKENIIDQVCKYLFPQERYILIARLNGKRYREIAKELGVSKQRIQQIERDRITPKVRMVLNERAC